MKNDILKENKKSLFKADTPFPKKWLGKLVYQDNGNALKSSHHVSYNTANAGNAHMTAKSLLKLCLKDEISGMLGEKHCKDS